MAHNFDSIAAMRAAEREALAPHMEKASLDGAMARGHAAICAVHDWHKGEFQRCGPEICGEALLLALSVPLSSWILTVSRNRDVPQDTVFQTVMRLLADNVHGSLDGESVGEKVKHP